MVLPDTLKYIFLYIFCGKKFELRILLTITHLESIYDTHVIDNQVNLLLLLSWSLI